MFLPASRLLVSFVVIHFKKNPQKHKKQKHTYALDVLPDTPTRRCAHLLTLPPLSSRRRALGDLFVVVLRAWLY